MNADLDLAGLGALQRRLRVDAQWHYGCHRGDMAVNAEAAATAIATLLSRHKEMREALTKAEAQFREYERMHLAKVRPEIPGTRGAADTRADNDAAQAKADRNREMADMLAATLTKDAPHVR